MLGLLRTIFPPPGVTGNEKLALLAGYLMLSACLAVFIAHFYAEPSRRIVRKWLRLTRSQIESEYYGRKQPDVEHRKSRIE